MLTQKDNNGLLFCRASGVDMFGISSWRNIIPYYTLDGAVTEINAEGVFALEAAAMLSAVVGDNERWHRYSSEAQALRQAMMQYMFNDDTGAFVLNYDQEQNYQDNFTADEVFPVLFEVAEPAVRRGQRRVEAFRFGINLQCDFEKLHRGGVVASRDGDASKAGDDRDRAGRQRVRPPLLQGISPAARPQRPLRGAVPAGPPDRPRARRLGRSRAGSSLPGRASRAYPSSPKWMSSGLTPSAILSGTCAWPIGASDGFARSTGICQLIHSRLPPGSPSGTRLR